MSTSIYDVRSWNSSDTYQKHDIVSYNGSYYYALKNLSANTLPTDANSWGGSLSLNGTVKPYFHWRPSYNNNTNTNPRVKSVKFGDGYEQRSNDGLNNVLLELDYTFELRTLAEASAILHFLTERAGSESFVFVPPPPYGTTKLFVCRTWSDQQIFENNFSIKAKFEEVAA